MTLDPFFGLTTQGFLALLFLGTGVHKAADLGRLTTAISAYRVIPAYLESPAAWLVTAAEIIVGVALSVSVLATPAAIAAAFILTGYLVLMSLSLWRGHRDMDCGCSLQRRPAPLSGSLLLRNGVLVAFAIAAAMPRSKRTVGWMDAIQAVAAVVCLALIYLSADSLLAARATIGRAEA